MPQDSEKLSTTIETARPPHTDEPMPGSFPAVVLIVVVVMILIFLLFHNDPSYYRAWIA